MRSIHRISGAGLLLLLACEGPTGPGVTGQWGGPEAAMTLSDQGGSVLYACGEGTVDPDWHLSPGGRWSATGRHYFGGGPVPAGGHQPHPASYQGMLTDSKLRFTVTLTDLGEILGPFTLVRNGSGPGNQCL